MSVLNIGMNDVSEQDQAIKDKLASKEGHIAALNTQLSRRNDEMKELRDAFNENMIKLVGQTNRVADLENDLKAQSTLLSNKKLAFQNVDLSLAAANATIKQRELDARDLEVKLDQLSHLSDEHKSRADKLAKEKSMLEARVRELQSTTYHQVPPITPSRRHLARSRSRSSSPSRGRIQALEQELEQLRSIVQQKETDTLLANEKASRAQDEQIRVGNEKIALEKKLLREISELKLSLQEKDDEMRSRDMVGEDAHRREKELEDRIDEDEVKHRAIVNSLRDEMLKAEGEVKKLKLRVFGAESRQVELVAEKEEALEALEKARAWSAPNASDATNIDNDTAQMIERLLAATNRLRSERDTLGAERDDLRTRLDFLQAESKFELEALRAKFAGGAAVTSSDESALEQVSKLRFELDKLASLHNVSDKEKHVKLDHLGLAVTASALVIQQLQSEAAALDFRLSSAKFSCNEVQEQLTKTREQLGETNHKLQQTEFNMELNIDYLKESSRDNDELRAQLEERDSELEQAITNLKAAEEAQEYYEKKFDDAESQRSSLALEVTNLVNELSTAKDELKAAESRYIELQHQQFNAMTKTDATRILQNELMEERARVGRRDEHLKMLQHDIGRMETTMLLQEERLTEMMEDLDSMTAAKEAMVEDCADARDARDDALSRVEQMEMVLEARLEEADRAVETLVQVIIQAVGNGRSALRTQREHSQLLVASAEEDHQMSVEAQEMSVSPEAHDTVPEEVRQSTIALAASQVGLRQALNHIREIHIENQRLQHEVMAQRSDMDRDSDASMAVAHQLETLQAQAAAASLDFTNRTVELERHNQNMQQIMVENQTKHQAVIEELVRSKEQLSETLYETQRALTESNSNESLTRLQKQYATQLAEARTQISDSERALKELQTSHSTIKAELQETLAGVQKAKQQLDSGMAQSLRDVAALESVAAQRQEEILHLQGELVTAQSRQEAAESALDEMKLSFHCLSTELETFNAQHEADLQTVEAHSTVQRELEGKLAGLQIELDDRSRELEIAVQETRKLEKEMEDRAVDGERLRKELDGAHTRIKDAEITLAQLQDEMKFAQSSLRESNEGVESLQQEKLTLQEEITTLEAEVQKSRSLSRYLESQLKESEGKIVAYKEELEQSQADLARSEKAANAAEVNLSLQGAQHKRETSELNRQLATLKSQPNLQNALAELEERNDEMEELLRKKCMEIEENDDRQLEMLKENKRLTTKVESLTRKVQTLQTKLAAAKASIPSPSEGLQANIAPQFSAPPPSSGSRSTADRPRSFTLTNVPSVSVAPPAPTLPASVSTATSYVPSPASHTPLNRAVSGPSSLRRPKTPERVSSKPPPVFKARTPERRIVSSPPESSSSSNIGKKRRAPDDFEAESLPPQGFTVDCVPSHEQSDDISATPRARRMLSGFQSGFTPVRNQGRPMISMPSPKRLMTMRSGARSSPVIADVTNSPRGQSSKTKRSWLGKIRGASQATSRPDGQVERDTS